MDNFGLFCEISEYQYCPPTWITLPENLLCIVLYDYSWEGTLMITLYNLLILQFRKLVSKVIQLGREKYDQNLFLFCLCQAFFSISHCPFSDTRIFHYLTYIVSNVLCILSSDECLSPPNCCMNLVDVLNKYINMCRVFYLLLLFIFFFLFLDAAVLRKTPCERIFLQTHTYCSSNACSLSRSRLCNWPTQSPPGKSFLGGIDVSQFSYYSSGLPE